MSMNSARASTKYTDSHAGSIRFRCSRAPAAAPHRLDQPGRDELAHGRLGNADMPPDPDEPHTPPGDEPTREPLARVHPSRALGDPLEVFRFVGDLGDDVAITAQELLTGLEVRAAHTAEPAPGSADLITTATQTGRTVTVVTNNSGAAVAAYLVQHHLDAHVGKIIGRDDPDPALMKPSPYRVRIAVGALRAEPEDCVFIGDSLTDVLAGLLGAVAVIGY